MQRYVCHKEVEAAKVVAVRPDEMPKFTKLVCKGSIALRSGCGACEKCGWERGGGFQRMGATLFFAQANKVHVNAEWIHRHKADDRGAASLIGGYFVQYADGYQSWSPAKAFEDGYVLAGAPAV